MTRAADPALWAEKEALWTSRVFVFSSFSVLSKFVCVRVCVYVCPDPLSNPRLI